MTRIDSTRIVWEDDDHPLMVGCYAVATVSYPINFTGDRRLQDFRSGGLWGIDVRMSNAYRREVESEQLEDLREHLKVFGVEMPKE